MSQESDFEKKLVDILNYVLSLMLSRKFTEFNIHVQELQIGKYIRSRDPLKELLPIEAWGDLTPDSAIYLQFMLVCDGEEHTFFGNFYIDKDGGITPIVLDSSVTDITPEEINEKTHTITEKAKQKLQDHWKEIWDVILFALNVITRRSP